MSCHSVTAQVLLINSFCTSIVRVPMVKVAVAVNQRSREGERERDFHFKVEAHVPNYYFGSTTW